ncbi:MAG: hypothetical protein WC784_04630 [Candidatus Shapirobacteria bacterium]|jgi:hypothetical protein
MEKAVVFSPLIIFFAFFAFLIFLFLRLIFRLISKSKNEEWSGVVTDKKVNSVEDNDTNIVHDYYFLVVKRDNGDVHNLGLSRELWQKFSIGDKLHKPKGKLFPDKI